MSVQPRPILPLRFSLVAELANQNGRHRGTWEPPVHQDLTVSGSGPIMRSSHLDKRGGPAYRRVSGRTSPAPHIAYKAAAAGLQLCKYLAAVSVLAASAAWQAWQRSSPTQKRRAAIAAAVGSLVLIFMLSQPMSNAEPGTGDAAVTSSWLGRWGRPWQRQQGPPPLQPCIPPDRATPWDVALSQQPPSREAGISSQPSPEPAAASDAQPDEEQGQQPNTAGDEQPQQQQQQAQAQIQTAEASGGRQKRLIRAYYPQQERLVLVGAGQQAPAVGGWQLVPLGRAPPVRHGLAPATPALRPAPRDLQSGCQHQPQLQQLRIQEPGQKQAAAWVVQDQVGTSVQSFRWPRPHVGLAAHGLPHARRMAVDAHPSQEADEQHTDQQEHSVEQQDLKQQVGSDQRPAVAVVQHQKQQLQQEAATQQPIQDGPQSQDQQQQQPGQQLLQQAGSAEAAGTLPVHRRRQRRRGAVLRAKDGSGAEAVQGELQQAQQQQQEEGEQQQEEGEQQHPVDDESAEQQQQQQQQQDQEGNPQEHQQAAEQEAGGSPAADAPTTSSREGKSSPAAPSPAASPGRPAPLTPEEVAAAVKQFDVAVVNDVVFHHEVTLGVVGALQAHRERLQVYVHPSVLQPPTPGSLSFGLRDYIQQRLPGTQLRDAHHKEGIRPCDVAIFISPEFSVDYYRTFIAASRPRFVIIFVHEPTNSVKRLRYLITMHPLVASVTLSPHVASVVTGAMKGMFTHWMMPSLAAGCSNACWEGAALQGKFEGSRRNYAGLWRDLLAARDAQQQAAEQQQAQEGDEGGDSQQGHRRALVSSGGSSGIYSSTGRSSVSLGCNQHVNRRQAPLLLDRWLPTSQGATSSVRKLLRATPMDPALPPAASSSNSSSNATQVVLTPAGALGAAVEGVPLVNVLGSGNPAALEVPPALWRSVRLYQGLEFADYYDTLCRSSLLLPLFNASSRYLVDKISSSVLASLAAGTPLVVPARFLEVYTPFKGEHVVLLEEGESESAVLHRLIAGGDSATARLAAARAALGRLAAHLNAQAAAKLDGIMAGGVGQPHSGPKQP